MDEAALYGNPALHGFLRSAAVTRRVPQSLLVEGAVGLGKKTFCRAVSKLLFCKEEALAHCGCTACLKLKRNSHPDVFYIAEEKGSDAGKLLLPRPIIGGAEKAISVSTIRKLSAHAPILPNEANCKLYVIDCTSGITKEAQNAFLKLLEEPPTFVQFILLAVDKSDLLDTILSRVQVLSVAPLGHEDFLAAAKAHGLERELAEGLFLLCEGNLGQALSLSAPLEDPVISLCLEFLQALVAGDAWETALLMEKFAGFAGKDRLKLYNLVAFLCKMCYLSFAAALKGNRAFPSFCEDTLSALSLRGPDKIKGLIAQVETLMTQIKANVTLTSALTAFHAGLHTTFLA